MCRERKAKRGKNGSDLATALGNLSRRYIFNRQFEDAEAAAREGYDLDQQKKWILINRANAEMFLGRQDAAMEIHTQHINDVMPENGNKKWSEVVADNFADLKAAGLEHPNIINIEKFLADKN